MEQFTAAERDYINLVESKKALLPEAFCTVKHNPLATKEDLVTSLMLFTAPKYTNKPVFITSALSIFFGSFTGKYRSLTNTQNAFDFPPTITQAQRLAYLDILFDRMMTYLPRVEVRIPPHTPAWETEKAVERRDEFLRHLSINKDRLLRGPPHSGEHTIDPDRAAAWVTAQKTPERQRLAKLLLDQIRYISHKELLHALHSCVAPTKALLTPGKPIVFLVGSKSKSNYYISLLFAHFWLESGGTIDAVFTNSGELESLNLGANLIDIDDMAYSGNQTMEVLQRSYKSYASHYRTLLKSQLENDPNYQLTYMFLPRYLIEEALASVGFRYIVVRAFMSESSYQKLSSEEGLRLPIQIVTHQLIRYLPGVSQQDKDLIASIFNFEVPATTVYFDHKVADAPSTYVHVLAQGIVPERMLMYDNEMKGPKPEIVKLNTVEGKGATFLPFIRQCGEGDHKVIPSRNHSNFFDLEDGYRCPYAWYKKLNYNAPSGGTRKRNSRPYSKSVSHRNLGSRARQKFKAIARSSRGSRFTLRRRAVSKS